MSVLLLFNTGASPIGEPPSAMAYASAPAPTVTVVLPGRFRQADLAYATGLGEVLFVLYEAGVEPVLAVAIVCGLWMAWRDSAERDCRAGYAPA